MPFLNVASYSERQQRAVQRILDQLARSNLRNETQYARLRKSARKPYQGCLSIYLPSPLRPDPPPQGPGTFTAWSYSLSQGGVGFVTPNDFDEQVIVVGIHLPNGSTRWLRGDVVRKRQFPGEEFFDYGVAFHAARAQAEQDKPALAASSA